MDEPHRPSQERHGWRWTGQGFANGHGFVRGDFFLLSRPKCLGQAMTNRFRAEARPRSAGIMSSSPTETEWEHGFHTLRRENLFRNPPTDHTAYPALQAAVDPHIRSFNRLFPSDGSLGLLALGLADIGSKTYFDGDRNVEPGARNKLTIRYKTVTLQKPLLPAVNNLARNREILPSECRERNVTYRGKLTATFEYSINDDDPVEFSRELGQLPIMVKSNLCHLENNPPALLVRRKEESEELGGYFIINGIEKIVRLLQVNRRNFPMAIIRPTFANRGPGYTEFGVIIRSVRPDETSLTNVLHYLKDGNVTLRFSWRKREYVIPIVMILKALIETNDREIYEGIVGTMNSKVQDSFIADRVELLLRTYSRHRIFGQRATRAWLGDKFRVVLGVPETMTNRDAGTEFLRKMVLVHLGNTDVTPSQDKDKFRLLLTMMRKLYALADGSCAVDNPDAVQNQELLLGGFLYGQVLKERLEEFLTTKVSASLRDYLRKKPDVLFVSDDFHRDLPSKIFGKANESIGSGVEYFLSTGNLQSTSGLDMQQRSGYTVVAEKLNFLRYISHFRSVHRGAFFSTLKTTTVRKLLPESWGFVCPVHTPDGTPCGLLNHLAHRCDVTTDRLDVSALPKLAAELGVSKGPSSASTQESLVVMLDGRVLGWCSPAQCRRLADRIRQYKVEGSHRVPLQLEIGLVPPSKGGTYPGLYMSSTAARMVRPVLHRALQAEDWVGPLEQPYMTIAVTEDEALDEETTHVELAPTNMLSILANMTPFSDFNQSPRNMYQCQMGKQTMGTPSTAMQSRADNKLYMLQTGQTPIVRPPLHNAYGFDNFPNGTNAVVAVISYTGYDMDDAMIVNKSAHERGFSYGSVYKTHKISLKDGIRARAKKSVTKAFGFAPHGYVSAAQMAMLDEDGLPPVGRLVRQGDVLCAYHTVSTDYSGRFVNTDGVTRFQRYREPEDCFVESVRILGADTGREPPQTVAIKLRIPRAPVVGDKFSSRHGQKGICSQLWPAVDMPFSERGMQPDIIINPHAFPSRMTIGMFMESLAGKAGALHGQAQDSTPFRYSDEEGETAADHFGKMLVDAGFNYHGNEAMYSGITGEELAADIFTGVVYYQRLRHMVSDKFQVRTTGRVMPTTNQPVHGRQLGGGIRVGEMERDALIAHGCAFLLQDRLLNCSDYTPSWLCRSCGSFLSVQPAVPRYTPAPKPTNTINTITTNTEAAAAAAAAAATTTAAATKAQQTQPPQTFRCRRCATPLDQTTAAPTGQDEVWEDGRGVAWVGGADTTQVVVPGALRFLDVELAAMGVRLRYNVGGGGLVRRGG
ncbi:DNA-directed RNA polymerase I subunit RPA2 [Ophiocordyceps camponoti-floridani]|uniref:DNA-directed RNA polymerase subunit beta n=1 Tax=Ophiocordyceps camponoti-floridani TaxID=2030778 RepID=A0A8H4Q319_9HYPO|nr:DNA-directed RNA polymerase I subunit RPA2 [Ophiocordyceps camponoti-floridani]